MKQIKEIMCTDAANPTVGEKACFRDVLEAMDINRMGAVSVVDGDGRLIGIITDGDLRRLMLSTQDTLAELFMKNVRQIMKNNPITVRCEIGFDACLAVFKQRRFWVVPVVDDDGLLIGIIHLHDLLHEMDK